MTVWFPIKRPPESIVERDIPGYLPLVCRVEFEVMSLDVSSGVNAVFADIEFLRLVAGSRDQDIGKCVVRISASRVARSGDRISAGVRVAVNR